MNESLRQWVFEASERPEVNRRMRLLYANVQERINEQRPVCIMSGRCCRFAEFGHRLYVTTIELASFVSELRAVDHPALKEPLGAAAGTCPFQIGKICGVHALRPFGCRMFFCDPTSTDWQHEQYEIYHLELKKMHAELSIPYTYTEWRTALEALNLLAASESSAASG